MQPVDKMIKGIAASDGVAIAKAFVLVKNTYTITSDKVEDPSWEWEKLETVIANTTAQINQILTISTQKIGIEKAIVFEAHKQIANDVDLKQQMADLVQKEKYNGAYAIATVYDQTIALFTNMDDPYFKQRASDVVDVKERLLANYFDQPLPSLLNIQEPVIIVADDLTPSQTALLDPNYVKGFVTNVGGKTSHAAIIARTLKIPAVLGTKQITELVVNNQTLAIDGNHGLVAIEPADLPSWEAKVVKYQKELVVLKQYVKVPAITLDKKPFLVEVNIANTNDLEQVKNVYSDGVGLFRSEFLYMENDKWPDVATQTAAYSAVLKAFANKPVVVRTLDIGGDKNLNYHEFEPEMNPFLGYRAIRFCLDHKEIFATQIEALLKASVHGKLAIMFPMIATVEEFLAAKQVVTQKMAELKSQNMPFDPHVQIGMMVEIPATVFLIDQFAKVVDFFSIGTNDLIQYSMAADRMSAKIAYLYQPNSPAILKAIYHVLWGAHLYRKPVAMCGEMASEIMSIPLLLGLYEKGLDAFSMNVNALPKAKFIINNVKHSDCVALAQTALNCQTAQEVNQLVESFLKKHNLLW